MASKRLLKDLHEIQNGNRKYFEVFDASDLFNWKVLVWPDKPPYCQGAFRIEIRFPDNYPIKQPKIRFITQIYHPNVHPNGNVDMGIICPVLSEWYPAITAVQLIDALLILLDEPSKAHCLRPELFDEYREKPEMFCQKAEYYTRLFAPRSMKEVRTGNRSEERWQFIRNLTYRFMRNQK